MSDTVLEQVHAAAKLAQIASVELAQLSTERKNQVLNACADELQAQSAKIIAANEQDINSGKANGFADSLIDRLALSEDRIAGIAGGLRQVAALADPIGTVIRGSTLVNGLKLQQVKVPLGVVGMIYEARPNVTADAFGISFKSGNAVLLRGSSSAQHSNAAIVDILRSVVADSGVNPDVVSLLPCEDRESVTHLIQARGLVDVVIPRGGAGLIRTVVENAKVPAIETGTGNCHVYIDADADIDQAIEVLLNGKTRRVSVCNATETVLVDAALGVEKIAAVKTALEQANVTIHGDEEGMVPATDEDWGDEYLSMDIAFKIVDGVDEAIAHINQWGSGHTEAVCTKNLDVASAFTAQVDSSAVLVNASTAFTDGEQFGFGAEIGISTQKLHARGPMGLPELTSTKWVVHGTGHTRAL